MYVHCRMWVFQKNKNKKMSIRMNEKEEKLPLKVTPNNQFAQHFILARIHITRCYHYIYALLDSFGKHVF